MVRNDTHIGTGSCSSHRPWWTPRNSVCTPTPLRRRAALASAAHDGLAGALVSHRFLPCGLITRQRCHIDGGAAGWTQGWVQVVGVVVGVDLAGPWVDA